MQLAENSNNYLLAGLAGALATALYLERQRYKKLAAYMRSVKQSNPALGLPQEIDVLIPVHVGPHVAPRSSDAPRDIPVQRPLPSRGAEKTPPSPAVPIFPGTYFPPFQMTDQEGKPVTNADLADTFTIVYFADDPKAIQQIADVMASFEELLREHVDALLPVVVADAGTNVNTAAYSEKQQRNGRPQKDLCVLKGNDAKELASTPKNYGSEASPDSGKLEKGPDLQTVIYCVSPDGEVVAGYGLDADPDQVAQSIAQYMVKYSHKNPDWKPKSPENGSKAPQDSRQTQQGRNDKQQGSAGLASDKTRQK